MSIELELDKLPIKELFKFPLSRHGKKQDCKCLICDTFHCAGSIASHLRDTHGKGKIYGQTYITLDMFGEPLNKKTKKWNRTKRSENSKLRTAQCLLCDYQGSEKAIGYHLRSKHNTGQERDVNFKFIGVPENTTTFSKKSETKMKITPTNTVLKIPIILSIPIVFGSITIEGNQ